MKGLQKMTAVLAAVLLSVDVMCGCTANEITLDTAAAGDTLLAQIAFADGLEKASEITAMLMYDLPQEAKIDLYIGNGSYADELAIITCQSAADVDAAKQAAQTHLQDVAMSFEDYIPEEAKKVEDAVVYAQGCYVIVCISADETAADQIKALF